MYQKYKKDKRLDFWPLQPAAIQNQLSVSTILSSTTEHILSPLPCTVDDSFTYSTPSTCSSITINSEVISNVVTLSKRESYKPYDQCGPRQKLNIQCNTLDAITQANPKYSEIGLKSILSDVSNKLDSKKSKN